MTQVSRSLRSHLGVVMSLAALTLAVVSADDNWPQFRGARAGVAADDPSLPDVWGPAQNIVWQIDVPGRSWSSPVVWGDHVFVTTAINTAEADTCCRSRPTSSRSNGGTMTFADIAKTSAPHRWVLYDIDFKTGKIRWEREVAMARAVADEAPEEQLCLRDAGDRRRAGLCVLRLRRPVRLRPGRNPAVVEADGCPQDPHRIRQRRLARAVTAVASTSSTTTKSSRSSPHSTR